MADDEGSCPSESSLYPSADPSEGCVVQAGTQVSNIPSEITSSCCVSPPPLQINRDQVKKKKEKTSEEKGCECVKKLCKVSSSTAFLIDLAAYIGVAKEFICRVITAVIGWLTENNDINCDGTRRYKSKRCGDNVTSTSMNSRNHKQTGYKDKDIPKPKADPCTNAQVFQCYQTDVENNIINPTALDSSRINQLLAGIITAQSSFESSSPPVIPIQIQRVLTGNDSGVLRFKRAPGKSQQEEIMGSGSSRPQPISVELSPPRDTNHRERSRRDRTDSNEDIVPKRKSRHHRRTTSHETSDNTQRRNRRENSYERIPRSSRDRDDSLRRRERESSRRPNLEIDRNNIPTPSSQPGYFNVPPEPQFFIPLNSLNQYQPPSQSIPQSHYVVAPQSSQLPQPRPYFNHPFTISNPNGHTQHPPDFPMDMNTPVYVMQQVIPPVRGIQNHESTSRQLRAQYPIDPSSSPGGSSGFESDDERSEEEAVDIRRGRQRTRRSRRSRTQSREERETRRRSTNSRNHPEETDNSDTDVSDREQSQRRKSREQHRQR